MENTGSTEKLKLFFLALPSALRRNKNREKTEQKQKKEQK